MYSYTLLVLAVARLTSAWMPYQKDLFADQAEQNPGLRIRGVNLGSLFVIEPWMASAEWDSMGCSGQCSEADCVTSLGQTRVNGVFKRHWATWITESDLDQMQAYGLNSIRIPVGFWLDEDLVYANESFPQGGVHYLDFLVGSASERGMYIVIDMHGAPGSQWTNQPGTGQVSCNE